MVSNKIQFFTATILKWKRLLHDDNYKEIVISSMSFLVKENRAKIFAFVIMPNHIHIVWQISEDRKREDVQRDFLKYTAQQIRFDLKDTNNSFLNDFVVNAKDRKVQIWQRNTLSVDLLDTKSIERTLNYIHNNPLQESWNLVNDVCDYKYSSAMFYEKEKLVFDFLQDYRELE